MAKANTAEGYTVSPTTVTAGNSGGGSGDAFSTVSAGAGGTIQAVNTRASQGSWSYLHTPATGVSNYTLTNDTGSTVGATASVDMYLTGYPSSETNWITPQTAAGAIVSYLNLTPTGKLKLSHTAGTLYNFTNSVPLNAWSTATIFYTIAAGTASVQAKLYDATGTLIEASPAYTTGNTGTTAVGRIILGKFTAAGSMAPYNLDNIKFDFTSATEYPPGSVNSAPTANAGPDQTSVEPYTTVTLTGAGSSDSDGTIASYNWTQVSGTAVTLSGSGSDRTFTAPNNMSAQNLVFGLTVTDNLGSTSTQDTVTISVLGSDIGRRISGAWQARRIRRRLSGAWV